MVSPLSLCVMPANPGTPAPAAGHLGLLELQGSQCLPAEAACYSTPTWAIPGMPFCLLPVTLCPQGRPLPGNIFLCRNGVDLLLPAAQTGILCQVTRVVRPTCHVLHLQGPSGPGQAGSALGPGSFLTWLTEDIVLLAPHVPVPSPLVMAATVGTGSLRVVGPPPFSS